MDVTSANKVDIDVQIADDLHVDSLLLALFEELTHSDNHNDNHRHASTMAMMEAALAKQANLWVVALTEHLCEAAQQEQGHRGICLRLCDANESRQLNHRYRGKDQPTNVLSFSVEQDSLAAAALPLGDLAICWPILCAEAAERHLPVRHHFAHLLIHGTLHLLGYDHQEDVDAAVMEAHEVCVLAGLGISDPYC